MTGSATFSQFSPWFQEAGTNLVAAETEHQDPEGKKTDYDQDIFRHVRNDADTWSQRLAPAPHLKMLTLKFLFLSDGRSQWSPGHCDVYVSICSENVLISVFYWLSCW